MTKVFQTLGGLPFLAYRSIRWRDWLCYAYSSVHETGWSKANPAPKGIIAPFGLARLQWDGIRYDRPLAEKDKVYIAIKPQNVDTFSQITIPLVKEKINPPTKD